ncbi:MAG: CHAT domain-containing tetratricopeptide repeat protein [Pseudomonadota bacterium]
MRRFLLVLAWLIFAGPLFAQSGLIDRGYAALDQEDYPKAIALADELLASDPTKADELDARTLIAIAQYYDGRVGQAFVSELDKLDREVAAFHGAQSELRLNILSILSGLQNDLGLRDSRMTDIQIVRITRDRQDLATDLVLALRNLSVDFANAGDPAVSLRFTALYQSFAAELLSAEDPLVMEATAMLATELIWADAPVRGLFRFSSYTLEDWAAAAQAYPEEAEAITDMLTAVEQTLEDESVDWLAEVDAWRQIDAQLGEMAGQVNAYFESGDIAAASREIDRYLNMAPPDDVLVAAYLNLQTKAHMDQGDFARARPYLAGLLTIPSAYAAAMDLPIPVFASALAIQGGAEDTLLEAYLRKGIEVENILRRPDPELLVDLNVRLGEMKMRNGDPESALPAFKAALEAAQGHEPDIMSLYKRALNGAGDALFSQERLAEAAAYFTRLVSAAEETDDIAPLSSALGNLALISAQSGEMEKAVDVSRRRLALLQARADTANDDLTSAQVNLALVLILNGDGITPELQGLIRDMDKGTIQNDLLRGARADLFYVLSAQMSAEPEALRDDPMFADMGAEAKAQLLAALGDLAYEQEELERAKAFAAVGQEVAPEGSKEHFDLALTQGRIAQSEGRHVDALMNFRRVTAARIPEGQRPRAQALAHLPYHLSAAFELAGAGDPDFRFRDEMFQIAQFASASVAGGALSDAIARSQATGAVAGLLRERQTLARQIDTLSDALNRARYESKSPQDLQEQMQTARDRQAALSAEIARAAPDLAGIAGLKPLSIRDVLPRLRPDEVMLVFASSDVRDYDGTVASFMLALTTEALVPVGIASRSDLTALSRALRCSAALTDPNCGPAGQYGLRGSFQTSFSQQKAGPAFDTALAHRAYQELFEPLSEIMAGKKRLIIVADQALMSLPFHLALKESLAPGLPLRAGKWLLRDHSIEVIPSVASFVALREANERRATDLRFLGVGDPLIGTQRDGAQPFECDAPDAPLLLAGLDTQALSRGQGAVRTRAIADLTALPDTRCELRQIARQFSADSRVLLHGEASESALKALNESGALRDFDVVSFATHGLVAGEIGVNEAGLVLTPPALPTAADDGLLTTQEIAALDLNAAFVILSACNTASGDSRNQEGLSGMASAFFFAGAKSLLVSHWPVYSDAAVDLTTRSFTSLRANPDMPRAEAVRLAMLAVLDDPNADARQSHPSYWAPFMIVGDGLGLPG